MNGGGNERASAEDGATGAVRSCRSRLSAFRDAPMPEWARPNGDNAAGKLLSNFLDMK